MENNERFAWAAAIMQIQPAHHILEIGCGVGLAVAQLLPLLKTGKITAIDRSATAIAKALKRNAAGIESRKVVFETTELLQFPSGNEVYDKVFSFNVNLFWTKKTIRPEADRIKSLLRRNGALYIFYGPMLPGAFDKIVGPVRLNLEREDLIVTDVLYHEGLNCCCLIAQAK
jgi:cyclopropane fatty-acyl-phospholipid synthase-like methyltransferase